MDTTPEPIDAAAAVERVETLLASISEIDPAEAVGPLSEIADLLEALLDGEGRP